MSTAFAACFWALTVTYALAVGAQFFGLVFKKDQWIERARWAIFAGLAVHTLLVAWRWVVTGHIPTIGNFENALFGAWFIVVMTVWAGWKEKFPLLAAGSLPFALLILGGGAMSDTSHQPMIASLQSPQSAA